MSFREEWKTMGKKIVVITSSYLRGFVEESYREINPECEILVVEYKDFTHISSIYKEYEESAIGFIVSGQMAYHAIIKAVPDYKKPIVYFQADSADFYRLLLEYMMEDRNQDLKRVMLDFLLTYDKEASLEYFLNVLKLPLIRTGMEERVERGSLGDLETVEKRILDRVLELWNEKKIDTVICLYSSNIPILEAHGIPCRYPYPEKEQLSNMVKQVLARSELKNMRENLPAVIAVERKDMEEHPEQREELHNALKEALMSIKSNLALDFILKEEEGGYHLYTSLRIVDFLTDEQKVCHLCNTLKEDYDIPAVVGYGIGHSITSAKIHAEDALKWAVKAGASCIMDEKKNVKGPLNGDVIEMRGDMSDQAYAMAEKCKLSTLTMQKLMSIIKMKGSNRLTTQELAERLGVTVRNANRILNNLEKGGAAEIVHTLSVTSKGRPVKVYELNLME